MAIPTEVCSKCGVAKAFTSEFFEPSEGKLRGVCRTCRLAQRRKRYASETPERKQVRNTREKKYAAANRERRKIYVRAYAEENKDKIKNDGKAYYAQNREIIKKRSKAWRVANSAQKKSTNAAWNTRNHEKVLGYYEKSRKKRRTRIEVRISEAISSQMWHSIKQGKGKRSWETLVGYNLLDLMKHLERQFHGGMSWTNHGRGGWHIDHIIPLSSFKFSSTEDPEFVACWALANLRPMWERENIVKGARRLNLL